MFKFTLFAILAFAMALCVMAAPVAIPADAIALDIAKRDTIAPILSVRV
jgi:hypothetical protein